MPSLLTGVELQPRDVEGALRSLETVVNRLAERQDARAVFPDVYALVTRALANEIHRQRGFFQEPLWMSRLAGRFAERYLETLAWSLEGQRQDCKAWEVAHGYAELGLTFPLQGAALGISAHINFDLALGLWQTIEEFGDTSPARLARYKRDYDAVNSLLAASLPEFVTRLTARYGCAATGLVGSRALLPVTGTLALYVLRQWREHVWDNVLSLVHARSGAERAAVLARIHRRSGLIGELFSLSSRVQRLGRDMLAAVARSTPVDVRSLAGLYRPSRWEQPEPERMPLAG